MKKFIILTLVLIMAISIIGCSSKPDYDLFIMQSQGEIADNLEALVEIYEQETGKTVKLINIRAGEDPMGSLRAEMNKKDMPVLFSVEGQRQLDEWIGGDLVLSLNDWDYVNEITFGQGGIERDGDIYGIPTAIEGFGYVYDERMLMALGLDESDIESLKMATYDDFSAFLDALTAWVNGEEVTGAWEKINSAEKSGVLANVNSVFAFPGNEGWSFGSHLVSVPFAYEFENQAATLAAKTTEFKYAPQYKGAIDLMVNNTAEGFSADLLQVDYPTQVNVKFGTGEVFFMMQGNWTYGDIASVDQEKADSAKFLPVKYPESADGVTVEKSYNDSITVFAPRYWAINNKVSEDLQKEAKAFIQWMYTSEVGKDYILNKFNYIPAVTGFDNKDIKNSLGQSIISYIEAGKTIDAPFMAMPDGWSWHDVGDALQEEYLQTGNDEAFDAVIDSAIAKWEELKK